MVPLFLDDCIDAEAVARQLRAAGHVVYMARELGLKGQDDEPQLIKATEVGAVLTTQNQGDFRRLHDEWQAAGRDHTAGSPLTRFTPLSFPVSLGWRAKLLRFSGGTKSRVLPQP